MWCCLLSAIGFTVGGIASGSIAASIQSGIGNVVAGSAFAALQSAGMSGALNAIGAAAGTVSMAAGAVALGELPEPPKSLQDDEEDAHKRRFRMALPVYLLVALIISAVEKGRVK